MNEAVDELLVSGVQHAAELLRSGAPPTERTLKEALRAGLERAAAAGHPESSASRLHPTELGLSLEGWPAVGGVDVALTSSADLPVLIELKWGAGTLYNCAWDALKLATALREGAASRAFMVAGAPIGEWLDAVPGSGLFGPSRLDVGAFFDAHTKSFAKWRREVKTRPMKVPDEFSTEPLVEVSLEVGGVLYKLRCAEVTVRETGWMEVDEEGVASYRGTEELPHVTAFRERPRLEEPTAVENRLHRGEGGSAYLLGDFEVYSDEGALGDMWPADEPEMPLHHLRRFRSSADREAFVRERGWLEDRRRPVRPTAMSIEMVGSGGREAVLWEPPELIHETADRRAAAIPSDDDWTTIWELLDRLDVWRWRRWYTPERTATDHRAWRVLIAGRGRLVSSRGYQVFPPDSSLDAAPIEALLSAIARISSG